MASSVRTREDVLALAGIDFVLCPERVSARAAPHCFLPWPCGRGVLNTAHALLRSRRLGCARRCTQVVTALASTPTAAGYNSGLSAQVSEDEEDLQPQLTPAKAKAAAPAALPAVTEAAFDEGLGWAGKELLSHALQEAVQVRSCAACVLLSCVCVGGALITIARSWLRLRCAQDVDALGSLARGTTGLSSS